MLLTALLLLPALSNAMAQEDETALMTINRFLACQAVAEHEPTGVTDTFPADTEKVYAYLEATKISADVQVSFVWYHEDSEVARVPLTIRQGNRWRTYASKKMAGRPGAWRVEIQDAKAAVLATLNFSVK
jgi:hypothetical protein